jgi:endonuclease/exonuclease/phosphatase family metal-dependent hydrolase
LTYNACGNVCDYVGVTSSEWADIVMHAIDHWSADAILFTELCYGQLSALRDALGDGWGYAWLASHDGPAGCAKWGTDQRFGMAILARHDATELPDRQTAALSMTADCGDSNPRQLLCALPLIEGESTLVCVTHLTTGTDECRSNQATEVADLTLDWSGGGATIVAGDLNAEPADPELDALYEVDGTGRYLEVDQEESRWWPPGCVAACRSGEPTFPAVDPTKKIDYIMFSSDHFTAVAGDAAHADGTLSDHRLLRGAASLR